MASGRYRTCWLRRYWSGDPTGSCQVPECIPATPGTPITPVQPRPSFIFMPHPKLVSLCSSQFFFSSTLWITPSTWVNTTIHHVHLDQLPISRTFLKQIVLVFLDIQSEMSTIVRQSGFSLVSHLFIFKSAKLLNFENKKAPKPTTLRKEFVFHYLFNIVRMWKKGQI